MAKTMGLPRFICPALLAALLVLAAAAPAAAAGTCLGTGTYRCFSTVPGSTCGPPAACEPGSVMCVLNCSGQSTAVLTCNQAHRTIQVNVANVADVGYQITNLNDTLAGQTELNQVFVTGSSNDQQCLYHAPGLEPPKSQQLSGPNNGSGIGPIGAMTFCFKPPGGPDVTGDPHLRVSKWVGVRRGSFGRGL